MPTWQQSGPGHTGYVGRTGLTTFFLNVMPPSRTTFFLNIVRPSRTAHLVRPLLDGAHVEI
jgi:hypothetical protein